jgi:hypothetical protein
MAVDYEFIDKMYENTEYLKNSPYAVRQLIGIAQNELKRNIEWFSIDLQRSSIKLDSVFELLDNDILYLNKTEIILCRLKQFVIE